LVFEFFGLNSVDDAVTTISDLKASTEDKLVAVVNVGLSTGKSKVPN
jgi:hypothetical protein